MILDFTIFEILKSSRLKKMVHMKTKPTCSDEEFELGLVEAICTSGPFYIRPDTRSMGNGKAFTFLVNFPAEYDLDPISNVDLKVGCSACESLRRRCSQIVSLSYDTALDDRNARQIKTQFN